MKLCRSFDSVIVPFASLSSYRFIISLTAALLFSVVLLSFGIITRSRSSEGRAGGSFFGSRGRWRRKGFRSGGGKNWSRGRSTGPWWFRSYIVASLRSAEVGRLSDSAKRTYLYIVNSGIGLNIGFDCQRLIKTLAGHCQITAGKCINFKLVDSKGYV